MDLENFLKIQNLNKIYKKIYKYILIKATILIIIKNKVKHNKINTNS